MKRLTHTACAILSSPRGASWIWGGSYRPAVRAYRDAVLATPPARDLRSAALLSDPLDT